MDWKVFAVTFFTLLVAELGDKTQLAVFSLAAEQRSPLVVFLGASAALVLVTLIGVFLGGLVGKYLPDQTVKLIAGGVFIVLGTTYVLQAIRHG